MRSVRDVAGKCSSLPSDCSKACSLQMQQCRSMARWGWLSTGWVSAGCRDGLRAALSSSNALISRSPISVCSRRNTWKPRSPRPLPGRGEQRPAALAGAGRAGRGAQRDLTAAGGRPRSIDQDIGDRGRLVAVIAKPRGRVVGHHGSSSQEPGDRCRDVSAREGGAGLARSDWGP